MSKCKIYDGTAWITLVTKVNGLSGAEITLYGTSISVSSSDPTTLSAALSGKSDVHSHPYLSNVHAAAAVTSTKISHWDAAYDHIDDSNPHGITAAKVNLGNVTNESKATMFTNPTFTGSATTIGSGTSTWTIDDETDNELSFRFGGQVRAKITSTGMSVNGGFSAGTISVSGDIISTYGNLDVGGAVYAAGPIYGQSFGGPIQYFSQPPDFDLESGTLGFYVGTTDPATKRPGWVYIII